MLVTVRLEHQRVEVAAAAARAYDEKLRAFLAEQGGVETAILQRLVEQNDVIESLTPELHTTREQLEDTEAELRAVQRSLDAANEDVRISRMIVSRAKKQVGLDDAMQQRQIRPTAAAPAPRAGHGAGDLLLMRVDRNAPAPTTPDNMLNDEASGGGGVGTRAEAASQEGVDSSASGAGVDVGGSEGVSGDDDEHSQGEVMTGSSVSRSSLGVQLQQLVAMCSEARQRQLSGSHRQQAEHQAECGGLEVALVAHSVAAVTAVEAMEAVMADMGVALESAKDGEAQACKRAAEREQEAAQLSERLETATAEVQSLQQHSQQVEEQARQSAAAEAAADAQLESITSQVAADAAQRRQQAQDESGPTGTHAKAMKAIKESNRTLQAELAQVREELCGKVGSLEERLRELEMAKAQLEARVRESEGVARTAMDELSTQAGESDRRWLEAEAAKSEVLAQMGAQLGAQMAEMGAMRKQLEGAEGKLEEAALNPDPI